MSELPSFHVTQIDRVCATPVIWGRFDRVNGLPLAGYLRIDKDQFVWGDIEIVDLAEGSAILPTQENADLGSVKVGEFYPWIDAYWNTRLVDSILDEEHNWCETTFAPSGAQYFKVGDVTGWQPVGDKLPDGAVALHVGKNCWEHEHCDLCYHRIDATDPIAYLHLNRIWLCVDCYKKYARNHDLSFMIQR